MSHLPRKDNKGMYYHGRTPFISRCQESVGAQWTNKIFSLFILFQMSGRGNGVWSLAGEIILRNYKSWKVEWSPLESKLWLFRVITWHFCLSLFSSDWVQSTKQMTAQWRFVFTPHSCLSSGVTGELYSKQNSSLNWTLINKSSFFICPLTARTPRTFLQINWCWFLIPP